MFKLNAAFMNVPQKRERIFFIANNQKYPKLKLDFNENPIFFGEVRSESGVNLQGTETKRLLNFLKVGDKDLGDIKLRLGEKESGYSTKIVWDNQIANTLVSGSVFIRAYDKKKYSDFDYINISSFPQDYDFSGLSPLYICGMSVPPNMMANIATEVYNQWLNSPYNST